MTTVLIAFAILWGICALTIWQPWKKPGQYKSNKQHWTRTTTWDK